MYVADLNDVKALLSKLETRLTSVEATLKKIQSQPSPAPAKAAQSSDNDDDGVDLFGSDSEVCPVFQSCLLHEILCFSQFPSFHILTKIICISGGKRGGKETKGSPVSRVHCQESQE